MAKRKKKNPVVKKKILVVDDEPDLVQSMAAHLVGAGYQVVTALDGREALQKATAERPDLIVLDDLVSPMRYIDVLLRLQADCRWPTASIPVIMVAEEPQSREVMRVPCHWDCWLTKPVDLSELLYYIGLIFDQIERHQGQT